MLTDNDVQKIIEANKKVFVTKEDLNKFKGELIGVFPTREESVSKDEFEELRQDFRSLQSAIDGYAKKADAYFEEMLLLTRRIDRLEKWAKQVGEKIGVKLEY